MPQPPWTNVALSPDNEHESSSSSSFDNHQQPSGCGTSEEQAIVATTPRQSIDDVDDTPSNEKLLGIAFVSFMSFSLLQLTFAWIAQSHAMMGDSAAMMVDALTYLTNFSAERRKRADTTNAIMMNVPPRIRQRHQRKRVLELEIVPPIISVVVLMVVTIVVTENAMGVLLLRRQRSDEENNNTDDDPNLVVMLVFSIVNLGLDGLNVFCFSKSKENTMGSTPSSVNNNSNTTAASTATTLMRNTHTHSYDPLHHQEEEDEQHQQANSTTTTTQDTTPHDPPPANLNMCSAFTHVFADTLRSVAVILAVLIAMVNAPNISASMADAVAALVVSILIVLSLFPLVQGLQKSVAELRAIQAEEDSEAMFLASPEETTIVEMVENN